LRRQIFASGVQDLRHAEAAGERSFEEGKASRGIVKRASSPVVPWWSAEIKAKSNEPYACANIERIERLIQAVLYRVFENFDDHNQQDDFAEALFKIIQGFDNQHPRLEPVDSRAGCRSATSSS
jgi:hypothetical protein